MAPVSERAGVVVGAAAFSASHVDTLGGSPAATGAALTGLFVTGLALGVVRARSGNLLVPMLAHGLYNGAVLVPTALAGLMG